MNAKDVHEWIAYGAVARAVGASYGGQPAVALRTVCPQSEGARVLQFACGLRRG